MKKANKILLTIASFTLLNGVAAPTFAQDNQLIRSTEFGQVEGYEEGDVLIWKGVPYGGDTSGENRWSEPTDPEAWEEVRQTTEAGDVAIQASADGIIGSEDALNLDIYRPDSEAENLPVLVFLHGGNNQTGQASEISGVSFTKNHDAIVVSINYRLGALGFNPLEGLKTGTDAENSGNYTLLDILKSLEWIQTNIESFGGDPDNVTLSGFSAGGRDVVAILASPIFEGMFTKVISFSGGQTFAEVESSQEVFAQAIAPLVVEDGEKETEAEAVEWLLSSDTAVRDYLLTVEADRLAPLMSNASIRMEVFPHLYRDGYVLPAEGSEVTYLDVPTMLISGSEEFSLFGRFDPYFASAVEDDTINTAEEVKVQYDFINKYGGELYSYSNIIEPANNLVLSGNDSVYSMEIQFGNDPEVVGEAMSIFGGFHGVFVPLLDEHSQNYTALVGEEAYSAQGAEALAEDFQAYLYQFMLTGDPNDDGLAEWNPYNPEGEVNVLVANADQEDAHFEMVKNTESYESIVENIEADTSVSDDVKEELVAKVLNGRWFSYLLDEVNGNLSAFYK